MENTIWNLDFNDMNVYNYDSTPTSTGEVK